MPDAPTQTGAEAKAGDQKTAEKPDAATKTDDTASTDDKATGSDTGGIDLSKLSGDQLNKVLENPDLFNTPRIKQLRERAAQADKLEKERESQAEKSLEEQKKFQELAEKRGETVAKLESDLKNTRIDQALTNKLVDEGLAVSLGSALKLVDRSQVDVGEDGSVSGVDDAIEALKKDEPTVFNNQSGGKKVGSATNAGNGEGGTDGAQAKFKRSQLRDSAFYKEHRDEILKAQAAGLIEDDLT